MRYFIDNLDHPFAHYLGTVYSLDQDLTEPLHSVIIITEPNHKLIDQIHTAWRGQDLLVVVLGTSREYYGYPDQQAQLKLGNFIRSLHYGHAHLGVVGPWLVHLRCSEYLSWEYIEDTIQWLANNRYRARPQDLLLAHNHVSRPNV